MKKEANNNVHSEEPSMHERLCALLFGELETPDAARLEAELEASAELREERDRLAATIGLLRTTRVGAEALSPAIVATLERAAAPVSKISPGARSPWYLRTSVQLAAGLAALLTGIVGGRVLMRGEPQTGPQSPPREELARSAGKGRIIQLGEFSGADGQGSLADHSVWLAANCVVTEDQHGFAEAPVAGGMRADGLVSGRQERAKQALGSETRSQDKDAITGLNKRYVVGGGNYRGPSDEVPPTAGTVDLQAGRIDHAGFGQSPGSVDNSIYLLETESSLHSRASLTAGGQAPPSGGQAAPDPLDAPTSLGDRRSADPGFTKRGLALDDKNQAASQITPGVTELAEAARRKATLSGPSTLGPAGPSTPGPRGPATPSFPRSGYSPAPPASNTAVELAGSDDFFLGHGERRTRREYRYEVGGDFDFESIDLGELTPAQIDALCERRTQRILQDCRRHDGEHPRDMFFRFWGDNPFELARLDNQSTFGVDVDTASYALARRYLQGGNLPTKAQIRTEEFVNYFKPDLAPPSEGDFRIHTELATSRFGNEPGAPSQRWMLRVGVRGREVAPEDRKPLALTFVVDTSGSMKEGNRLELVKHALRLLVGQLHGSDSIAIVGFNNSASLILPLTSAQNRGLIEAAIYGLSPNGGTNAESGLRLGYEVASAGLTPGAHNRVVLLSDGVANIGQTDQDRVNADVKRRRDEGIYLNTIGVGMSNHNDVFLEQLANKGDGLCNYVDSAAEARRALVDNFMGAFEPIARDVKIQVEFDSNQVYRYRLLGYENRAIADADFRNDVVDAGEIGAGHQVVALYELELTGSQSSEPLATVRLRWKEPTGPGRDPLEDGATEMAQPVSFSSATTWEGAPQGYRRSALVAQFAEILRRSVHARSDSLDELMAETSKLVGPMGDSDLLEFLTLLQTSRELILRHTPQYDDLSHCIDSIRRNRILHAQYEELRRTEKVAVLSELEHANQELEQRIRDLIRKELQEKLR